MNSTMDMTSFDGSNITEWGSNNSLSNTTNGDENNFDYETYYREQHIEKILNVITMVCYSLTMFIGSIGNVIVIYTIWRCRQLHTVMYTLLASLSFADLIMLLFVLPWRLRVHLHIGYSWLWGDFMCRFPQYVHFLTAVSSVFHLSAISMERCYAVKFPLKSRTKLTMGNAYKIIAVVWIGSILASIPQLFSVSVETFTFDGIIYHKRCRGVWKELADTIFVLYKFVLVFAIPIIQITGSYAFIIRTIYTRRVPSENGKNRSIPMNQFRKYEVCSTRNGNGTTERKTSSVHASNNTHKLNQNSAKNREAEIRQIITMLVLVVLSFVICWGPLLTFTVIGRLHLGDDRFMFKWRVVSTTLNLLSLVNSAINPIIYALVSVNFRQNCFWAIKVCCKPRNVRRRMSGNVSRATTVSRIGANAGGGSTVVDTVSVSSLGDKI